MMHKVRNNNIQHIIGALFVAMIPNIPKLPFWIAVWCILLWGYMVAVCLDHFPWPNKWFRYMLTGIGLTGILLFSKEQYKGSSYLGLLTVMATLKPMEIASYRDMMVSIFIAYFIVITSLFESESLFVTVYMFVSVFFTTGVLIHINNPSDKLRKQLRLSGRIMLQAFPLVLLLFLLFPRIQGTLWGVTRQKISKTGFSDSMSPGDISRLIRSTETAFIVKFDQPIPERHDLYFRGIVLWHFDGTKWTGIERTPVRMHMPVGTTSVSYHITLEPHGERWLFALDLPKKTTGGGTIFADHTIKLRRRFNRKIRYTVESITDFKTQETNKWGTIGLKIPETGNPESRKLALQWKNNAVEPDEIVSMGLRFFQENDFQYTLNPPVLKKDKIDDFLFHSQKGFCEHYASAFAFLMRAAGIPSRVVLGYHGGVENSYGNFIVVRQSEAHAWVEVWHVENGWMRVDPTSVVAPGRIEMGLEGALQEKVLPGVLVSKNKNLFSSLKFRIELGWEALNTQWDIWFSGYSSLAQKAFLEKLGIKITSLGHQIRILIMILSSIALFGGLFLVFYLNRVIAPRDRVQEIYLKFCKKLEKIGFKRNTSQGPADFARNVVSKRPYLGSEVFEITDLYIRQRYAEIKNPHTLKKFKSLVRNFNPKRLS